MTAITVTQIATDTTRDDAARIERELATGSGRYVMTSTRLRDDWDTYSRDDLAALAAEAGLGEPRYDTDDADLLRADLQGADLRIADLRRACLVRADLTEVNLRGADLTGATL